MKRKNIFITGGAGYIGSHTCIELLQKGYNLVVYDNFANSQPESLKRVQQLTGKTISLIQGDIRDKDSLKKAMTGCDAVIHFAGLKAVGESVKQPLTYYENNVFGSLCLLQAMQELGITSLVFSSSATVYGDPQFLPLTENHPLATTNPYGETKLIIENMIKAHVKATPNWHVALLRYFNPVGAHESGLIGEDPKGIPNNLMPFVSQVAIGKHDTLAIFGNDYDTADGTGVRDYIHVVDLAKGHIAALTHLLQFECETINLGTGNGHSVLDVVHAFEQVSGKTVSYRIEPRRSGDVASCYADPGKAARLLNWRATYDLNQMCHDSWNWQTQNPTGFNI